MTFAQQLRAAMNGMTQESLEAKSGVHQATISRYLRGAGQPTLRNLDALEAALPALRDLRSKAAA